MRASGAVSAHRRADRALARRLAFGEFPMKSFSSPAATDLSRRRFVQGIALGGAVAGLGLLRPGRAWAQPAHAGQLPVLSGTDFALAIGQTPVN